MQPAIYRQASVRILYDADRLPRPAPAWFDPAYWQARGEAVRLDGGRGATWRLQAQWGDAVLRLFRRGGRIRYLSHDRYWFRGWEASRSIREWRLLAELRAAGLAVPAPLAALCWRSGLSYRAGLMTALVPGARTAGAVLASGDCDTEAVGQAVGARLAGFHAAGLHHADLNLGNILQDHHGQWWLIDLDRGCRYRRLPPALRRMNLRRLRRSLEAEALSARTRSEFWVGLCRGYRQGAVGAERSLW